LADPIDLTAEREKRDGPDPEFIVRDSAGRRMVAFGIDFNFGDSEWSFHIFAYDMADAEERVKAIRETARISGQIMSVTPA